jgi:DNA repair exonuclease SbcCD ATPase subunit
MIKFEKIRWKNFLSTGNVFTEVYLDRSPTTVITGDNGSGKSTILDALCWVLFNKPFRNIRMLQLINTINGKDTRAEIEFSIGNSKFKVIRGYKPSVFEIWKDDKLLPQPGSVKEYQTMFEDTILKLNYKSFTQIVVLGNATFTPFMQLSVKDRREVIDDLLDIQIFSQMNTLLKDRLSKNRTEKQEVEYQIELGSEKIRVQREYISRLQQDVEKQRMELEGEISDWNSQLNETIKSQGSAQEEISLLLETISNADKVNSKTNKVSELMMKLHDKVSKAEKRVSFYEKNDHCPTCEQVIEANAKAEKMEVAQKIVDETQGALDQLQKEQSKLTDELARINGVQQKITSLQQHWRDSEQLQKTYQSNIKRLKDKLGKLQETEETEDSPVSQIQELETQLIAYEKKKESLSKQTEVLSIASQMLRDGGIKKKIIKQYVPIMNKLVNKYLASLDFFVNFELDEEFNEVIKSRHRDEFSYASFSEGEKMRIDLALLFTWRAVAKLKNSTNTNLLILDEVFDASLDTSGCDEFLKLLNEVGGDTNVFVISHKGDVLTDKFRSQIRFEKVKNFSRIAV